MGKPFSALKLAHRGRRERSASRLPPLQRNRNSDCIVAISPDCTAGNRVWEVYSEVMSHQTQVPTLTRRQFLKGTIATTATVALGTLSVELFAHAQGSDRIRVGLVGCGGRGTGALLDALNADPGTVAYALADLFPERIEACLNALKENFPDRYDIPKDRQFLGFDAYKRLVDTEVDYVLFCTPPAFRPPHFLYAVERGKHVFMEKPVAVCPEGVRMILRGDAIAREKRLGVLAGTQYRHHPGYQGVIARLREGHIGQIRALFIYYNAASPRGVSARQPNWTEMEYQLRNWLFYTWLSGDQPVEQFVHNIDVMNWVMDATPVKAIAVGGRQVRTAPEYGDVYDHFCIEYEFANGVRVMAMCRQWDNTSYRISNLVVGSEGEALLEQFTDFYVRGKQSWEPGKQWSNPYVLEHRNLLQSLRKGEPLNEARQVAESTLTAIMGRMAAYTGKEVTWEQAMNSQLNYVQRVLNLTLDTPAYHDPVPIPGKTPLV